MSTQDEMELHYQRIADRSVKKVFAILGVDIEKPESVEEFREDLRFGRKLRKSAGYGWMAIVGIVAAAVVSVAWAGIKTELGIHT